MKSMIAAAVLAALVNAAFVLAIGTQLGWRTGPVCEHQQDRWICTL